MQPVVLVTGATGGIGAAIAQTLAAAGWRVFGTSRSRANAPNLPGVEFVELDLSSEPSIHACLAEVLRQAGRVDALVHNAGVLGPAAAIEENSLAQAWAVFETNFFGVFALTNAALPHFIQQGSGRIVFVSSTGGRVAAIPFFALYTASKHALEAYAEGLRREVAPFGVQVSLVEPGYTQTGMMDQLENPAFPQPRYDAVRARLLPLERFGLRYGTPPAEVARAVQRALASPRPALHYPVGSDSRWIIALERLLPQPLFEQLLRWMFFDWQPRPPIPEVPTPRQLGIRALLFHRPTRDRLLRAAGLAAAFGVALAWKRLWKNPHRPG